MTRKLTFLILALFALISGPGWGQTRDTKTLTFDLTSNPGEWPTVNSTTLTNYTYTLDGTAYTFALKNVKCNSGYLMMTSTAVLGLPAIENYKLTKVVATNSGGCSTSTKVGISSSSSSASYISGGEIQTWSTTSSTYTYNLSGTNNNTMYYLYVTNKNAQVTELTLTYEDGTTPERILESIYIDGEATKLEYFEGESFDVAGLKVMGVYDTGDDTEITQGINWSFEPEVFALGNTSVAVTAKVGDFTSEALTVNNIVVKEFVQTYANTYTSNVELTTTGGTSASTAKVKWDNVEYDALKCGTGSVAGACVVTIPANAQTLHFHAAGWKGETVVLNETFNLVADGGVASSSPFTLQNDPEAKDYFTLDPQGATSITFTATSGNRFVLFGVNAEEGPVATLESISIKTVPDKVNYLEGENFDPTGLVITKHFVEEGADDEDLAYSETTASQFSFNPTLTAALAATDTQVEITVGGKSVNQAITVTEAPKYTATTSINGVTTSTPDIAEFTLTQATAPTGFDFAGWTTTENDVDPTHFVSGTVQLTANTTFYAVFSKVEGGIQGTGDYVKITSAPTDWSGEYLIVFEEDGVAFDGSLEDLDVSYNTIQVNISNGIIAQSQACDNSIFTVSAIDGGYSIRSASGKYIGRQAKSNGLSVSTTTEYINIIELTNNVIKIKNYYSQEAMFNYLKYNSNNDQERFRYFTSDSQNDIALYKKSAGTPGVTHYYTRVFNETVTADITIAGPSIIPAGSTLNMGTYSLTSDNAANLIIEDGAQLIHSNDGVQATMRKEVAAYSTTEGVNDGWHFVASPMATLTSHNLNNGTFDLYKFEQTADKEWKNYESTAFSITNKEGYLYANAANTTIEFVGTLNATDGSKTLAYEDVRLAGFNLIGNPFACNANIGIQDFYICDGESITLAENSTIAPCTGIMVKANATGESVTFVKGEETTRDINAMDITIAKATRNANTMDRARINFSGDSQLSKFFFNENSCLYISQNGDDFAVVAAQAQGELPVNFKAAKNGTYTITVNTENVDAEYLHLIDNITGMDTDLLSTPSYTFEAKTSDYASRFKLVFGVNNTDSESSDSNFAYMSDGNLVIDNIEGQATLQIVDELGRVISTETVSGSYNKALNLKAGLYIINLNGMTQKIVVE